MANIVKCSKDMSNLFRIPNNTHKATIRHNHNPVQMRGGGRGVNSGRYIMCLR